MIDFHLGLCFNGSMKSDFRISVKDFSRCLRTVTIKPQGFVAAHPFFPPIFGDDEWAAVAGE